MSYLVTLLLTLGVVLVAMWVFVKVGTPVYRLDRDNVIALLELVLSGKASENDWHVFMGIPLRHNRELHDVQKRCEQLAETEFTGIKDNKLFTAKGLAELESLLLELKNQVDSEDRTQADPDLQKKRKKISIKGNEQE